MFRCSSHSSRELRGFRRAIHSPVKYITNHRKKSQRIALLFFNQSKILPISIPVRVIYRCGRINSIDTDAHCNHAYRFERFIYRRSTGLRGAKNHELYTRYRSWTSLFRFLPRLSFLYLSIFFFYGARDWVEKLKISIRICT